MSNRTYTIVLALATTALIAVLVASYFLHRLTLSPAAVILLALLFGVPLATILRLSPAILFAKLWPQFWEQMGVQREAPPAYAVRSCWLSLAASFAVMIAGPLLMPADSAPNAIAALVMFWVAFFFYGWLGLILTSKWVQTHGVAIAFAAIGIIGLSAVMLLGLAAHSDLLSRFFFAPLGLALYGVFMIMTPINVSFFRLMGLID